MLPNNATAANQLQPLTKSSFPLPSPESHPHAINYEEEERYIQTYIHTLMEVFCVIEEGFAADNSRKYLQI